MLPLAVYRIPVDKLRMVLLTLPQIVIVEPASLGGFACAAILAALAYLLRLGPFA